MTAFRKYIPLCLILSILLSFTSFSKSEIVSAHVSIAPSPTTPCNSLDSTDFLTHVSNQIDNRLSLASTSVDLSTYTSRPTTSTSSVWSRNPNVWTNKGTPINFTGVAGWSNGDMYSPYYRGATLITPRHFISANHFYIPVGSNVTFFDVNGNPATRKVVASQDILDPQGNDTDINVEALDSDVPDSITYYPLFASSTLTSLLYKYPSQSQDIPIVVFNQDSSAIVHSLLGTEYSFFNHATYTTGTRAQFSSDLRVGDSGQPAFIIVDNKPVLLFTHYTAGSGANLGAFVNQINAAISTFDSTGYQATLYNPICFNIYQLNHYPQFTSFTSPLSLSRTNFSSSVPISFLSAKDDDVGQTLTISLTGLSSISASTTIPLSNYFSFNSSTGALYQLQPLDQNMYGSSFNLGVKVVDNGMYSASSSGNIRINYYDSLNPHVILYPQYNASILGASTTPSQIKFDANDRLYIDSSFPIVTTASTTFTGGIIRLTNTGTLDTSFNSALYNVNGSILGGFLVQNDGKIVIGGAPLQYGASSSALVRLTNDGSIDTPFMNTIGTGPSALVRILGAYNDQIILMGTFTSFNGISTPRIVRLNSNGSVDTTFLTNVGSGFSARLSSGSIVQSGTDIVIGANFASFNGNAAGNILKLYGDGTLDASFAQNAGSGFNGSVGALGILSDGKIIAVGNFSSYNGVSVPKIALLNSDGTLNTLFQSHISSITETPNLLSVAVQSDDKILIGANGNAMSVNGRPVGTLVRFNKDGTLDTDFQNNIGTGVDGAVNSIDVRSDKTLAIAGLFNKIDSQSTPHLALFSAITPSATVYSGGGGDVSSGGGGGGGSTPNVPAIPVASSTTTIQIQKNGCIVGALFNIYDGSRCLGTNYNAGIDSAPLIPQFTANLTYGAANNQVKLLQNYLNAHGFIIATWGAGSVGNESNYFGAATKAALVKFQKSKGIMPASGYFGPLTRAYISQHP